MKALAKGAEPRDTQVVERSGLTMNEAMSVFREAADLLGYEGGVPTGGSSAWKLPALARRHARAMASAVDDAPSVHALSERGQAAMVSAGFITAGGRVLWRQVFSTSLVAEILWGGLDRRLARELEHWWKQAFSVRERYGVAT